MGDQATLTLLYSDSLQIQLIILHGKYHLHYYTFMGFDIHGTFICIHNSINTLVLSGDSQVINNLTDRDFSKYFTIQRRPLRVCCVP